MKNRILAITCLAAIVFISSSAHAGRGSFKPSISPSPPDISFFVTFSEPSGNNILDAGETAGLAVTVKNSGKGDAFDVKAVIDAVKKPRGLAFDAETAIGTIAAGKSVVKKIALIASEETPTADVKLNVEVKEANGFEPDAVNIAFSTRAFEPPKLVVADFGIDDQSGNSRVEPQETVEVTARVQNAGHGGARGVTVDVLPGANVFMGGESVTHFELGALPPGAFRDVKFMFYTNKRIKNGEKIPVTLRINEARDKYNSSYEPNIVMNAPQRSSQEIVVKGESSSPKAEIEAATGLSVDVDVNIPVGKTFGKDDVAVIIGNKNYSAPGVPPVEFADRDAAIIREYLLSMGFARENVIFEKDATLGKFNEILGTSTARGKLARFVKANVSNVFVYYVGHGAPDLNTQEAYFVPSDANPSAIETGGYPLQMFYDNLGKLPAKKITVVLDSCFSGNSNGRLIMSGVSPALVKVRKEYNGPANASVITSAAVDQVSSWYPDKRHSMFTYFFLKAIGGDADADRDRKVTIGELRKYLGDNVPYMALRLSSVEQTPVVNGADADVLVMLK
ncbi:MAG: caspase family protein [Nitrospirae bacterium]|nr:caspase family protein [Nitrospirota bacterium]